MLKIGITGSFASGKSFVLNHLKTYSCPTFSADEFVSQLYNKRNIQEQVLKILPELKVFDKKKIAKIIFDSARARCALQDFIHPFVIGAIESFSQEFSTEKFGFIEVPLLFEANLEKYFDFIITTYCSEETRLARARTRASFNQIIFDKISKIQLSQQEKIKMSDFVLNTDVKLIELPAQIDKILKEIECSK